MRVVVIIAIIIFLTITCSLAYKHYQDAFRAENELQEERYLRITAEEKLTKATDYGKSLEKEIDKVEKRLASTKKLLEHTQLANKELKNRLEKAAKIRDILDKQIEELKKISVME